MALPLLGKRTKEPSRVPPPPPTWPGSLPEWAINWALLKSGMLGRYNYQSARMGGRLTKGGVIVDFEIPELNLVINVQSPYYHYSTTLQRQRGEMQKAQLTGMGLTVIFIDEADALRNPVFYVQEALKGRDHSKFA